MVYDIWDVYKITFPRDTGCVEIVYFAFARCFVAWNHCRFYVACVFHSVCFLKSCFKGAGFMLARRARKHVTPNCTCRARKKIMIDCFFKRGDSGFCFWISAGEMPWGLGLINSFWLISTRHEILWTLDKTSVVFHFKIGICGALMSWIPDCKDPRCFQLGSNFLVNIISSGFIWVKKKTIHGVNIAGLNNTQTQTPTIKALKWQFSILKCKTLV